MLRWRYLFTQPILSRGMEYFRLGCVKNLSTDNGQYGAIVKGEKMYRVLVSLKEDEVEWMDCDCPFAASGNHCKHMAAVLFAIEKKGGNRTPTERKKVKPFSSDAVSSGEEEYRYFDIERITKDLVWYEDTYQKARTMVNQKKIENFQLTFGYPANGYGYVGSEMAGDANGYVKKDGYTEAVQVLFNRNGILRSSCGVYCAGFDYSGMRYMKGKSEPNVYIAAMLLLIADELAKNNVGDSTDCNAQMLLNGFRVGISGENRQENGQTVMLEPRLVRNGGELTLSLRTGTEKFYVIKNISEFVECVEQRQEFRSGKMTLDFSRDRIAESDGRLYKFVKGIVYDLGYQTENLSVGPFGRPAAKLETLKSSVKLYGSRLDQLYDILSERAGVHFTDKDREPSASGLLSMGSDAPEITITIHKDVEKNGPFHGITAEGTAPVIIEGADYNYYIGGGQLNRIPPDRNRKLEPLFRLLNDDGKLSFKIGRGHLSEFYYTVLPALREIAEVEERDNEVVAQYLPPEVEFVFYLDAEDGVLSCRAAAGYGEQWFSAMDALSPDASGGGLRDLHREAAAVETVMRYFPETDRERGVFLCPRDDDSVYELLTEGVAALMNIGEVQATAAFKGLNVRSRINVKVGVSVESNLMDLTISSTDVTQKELLEILKSYQLKKRYHRLKNGDFVKIDETIEELGAMVDTMHLSGSDLLKGQASLPIYRALYLDKMTEKCDALRFQRDRYFKKIAQEFKTVSESDFEVPESLQSIMRNYQLYGHKWLRTLEKYGFGGILADDMGLGKTLQVISVFAAAKAERGAEDKALPSLVVCPASLVYNWQEEIHRFAPSLSCVVIAGTQKERQEIIQELHRFDVAITSYDLLKRDIASYENVPFAYQVIDEAQYIKTHTTAAAKAVKVIQSRVRYALTGTPIENRLSELWSIFDYLMPGFLYGYETFKKDFETPIAKKNDEQATEKLKRMVSPFILRRLKADVLRDLPEKIEEVRYAAFEGEQQRLYDAQVAHMKGMLESQDEQSVRKNKIQILAELTKIRQICCDPSLIFEDYRGESAKRAACLDLVKSAIDGEHRILLFSQFTTMLELLEQDLRDAGIEYYKITGATPKAERMELVKQFNAGDTPVFLISLKSGGTGLNLTGADVVIHYDPWWNVAAQNQATDRAHRIGQTKVVSVYRLIARHSVEEKILELQETKKNLADEILTGEMGHIGSLSREDLLSLVQ